LPGRKQIQIIVNPYAGQVLGLRSRDDSELATITKVQVAKVALGLCKACQVAGVRRFKEQAVPRASPDNGDRHVPFPEGLVDQVNVWLTTDRADTCLLLAQRAWVRRGKSAKVLASKNSTTVGAEPDSTTFFPA